MICRFWSYGILDDMVRKHLADSHPIFECKQSTGWPGQPLSTLQSNKNQSSRHLHNLTPTHNLRPRLISFPIRLLSVALDKILRYRLSTTTRPPANPHDVAEARWTNPRASGSARSYTATTLNAKATYRHTTEARSFM
jgi:hypothetical protein